MNFQIANPGSKKRCAVTRLFSLNFSLRHP